MNRDKVIEFLTDHPDFKGYDYNALKRIVIADEKESQTRSILNKLDNDENGAGEWMVKDALVESLCKKLSWIDIDNLNILIAGRISKDGQS